MTEGREWIEWSPQQAPHVVGRYEKRIIDAETGMPEPQEFVVTCSICGMRWPSTCTSGMVRTHIQRFAASHQHRDRFGEAERVVRPGSLRRRAGPSGDYED